MIGRFVGASVGKIYLMIALFGIAAYASYKVNEARQFKELYFDTLPDKRQFLLQTHQSAAYQYDNKFDQYEMTSKIVKIPIYQSAYRKTIAGLCSGKILETGVGTSRNIKYYPHGSDVTAVDWSSNALEVALLKPATNIKIQYRLDDVENLSFAANTFDCILDTFGMEYYLNPERALQEMKRGGKILLLTTGRSSYDILNLYLEYKQAKYLKVLGNFCNRDWSKIIKDDELLVISEERKINGTVYFYVLENCKKQ